MVIGRCLAAQVVMTLSMGGYRMTVGLENWRKPICRGYLVPIGKGWKMVDALVKRILMTSEEAVA